MFGKHIGQLNVYVATNTSERLIWSQSGNQGDRWMFTQNTLQAEHPFKVLKLDQILSSYLHSHKCKKLITLI